MTTKKHWSIKAKESIHTALCGRIARGYVSLIFTGTMDRVEFMGGNIQIGWYRYHVDYWLSNHEILLSSLGYDARQINEYYDYIKFCADKYASVMGKVCVN